MSSVIYKISSKINNKFYVGSAVNYNKRTNNHISDLRNNRHANRILQNHVNKYGLDDLEFSVLEEIKDLENLIPREQFYIDSLSPNFNICIKANSRLGAKHTPEAIEKQKISHSNMSEETKKKIGDASRGRIVSEETRKKLSIAGKGRKVSEHTKQLMREVMQGKKRTPMSEERKKKISNAHKIRLSNPEERLKLSNSMKLYFKELDQKKKDKNSQV